MRSLLTSLFRRGPGTDRAETARGRPEALRRKTIGANARIILATNLLAAPVAVWFLLQGALMPFVITVIGLCAGVVTMELHRRGQF